MLWVVLAKYCPLTYSGSTPMLWVVLYYAHTVPKVIDFPRYNMKSSRDNVILRGIVHVVSGFPLHFMFYRGNLDCFSNRASTAHLLSKYSYAVWIVLPKYCPLTQQVLYSYAVCSTNQVLPTYSASTRMLCVVLTKYFPLTQQVLVCCEK